MMDDSRPEKECDSSFDVINKLPECIKVTILEYLPIKEAVRTCILSKDWRHTWSKVLDLYIDVGNKGSNSRQMMAPVNEEDLKNIRFIDQVLNLHNGNVHTLEISGAKPSQKDFERWMLKLSQMQIKKLILKLDCERSWTSLRPCQIKGLCAIKLPEDFNGLKLLRSLHFKGECKINETDMTKLISSCPLLEELVLYNFSYCVLKIHALNLQRMSIVGNFGDLFLQTPKLVEAFIFINNFKTVATLDVIVGRNLLSSISHIQHLSIYCQRPDLIGSSQAKNPPILCNLIGLCIYLRPSNAELTFMLLLLRNSPKLIELMLSSRSLLSSSFLGADEQLGSSAYEQFESGQQGLFSCLQRVLIKVDRASNFSIAFAKFILKNAPVLEELIIWGNIEDWTTSWSCDLKGLSVTAKIIFKQI